MKNRQRCAALSPVRTSHRCCRCSAALAACARSCSDGIARGRDRPAANARCIAGWRAEFDDRPTALTLQWRSSYSMSSRSLPLATLIAFLAFQRKQFVCWRSLFAVAPPSSEVQAPRKESQHGSSRGARPRGFGFAPAATAAASAARNADGMCSERRAQSRTAF